MNASPPYFSPTHRLRALRGMLVALLTACFALPLYAETADQNKPINVVAGTMTYDDLKQITIFTGNVVATKGTILVKGDRIEVRQDPEGYQYATVTASNNKLAYFRQKREGLNEYVEGDAEHIYYDGKQDLTTLTKRATVRRLQGLSTVLDTIHGSVITSDGQKNFYTAKGGKDIATSANPTGRVSAMLGPRRGGAAPLAGAPAKLLPSSTLKGTPAP